MATLSVRTATPSDALTSEGAIMILGDDQPKLLKLAQDLEKLIPRIEIATIKSDADSGQLNNMLSLANEAASALEKIRVKKKGPILEEGRALDALFKPSSEAMERIEKIAKKKLKDHLIFKQNEAARRLEESIRLQIEADAKQREAYEAQQAATTVEEKKAAEVQVRESNLALIDAHRAVPGEVVPTSIRSDFGFSSLQFRDKVEIKDLSLVPREYLESAMKLDKDFNLLVRAIKAAIKNGATLTVKDHGVNIYEDSSITNRPGIQ